MKEWGQRAEKGRQLVELGVDQNQSPIAPPRTKKGGNKGDVRKGVTASIALEKVRSVRVIDGKEVRRDNPMKYFLSAGIRIIIQVPGGMILIEIFQIEKIYEGTEEEKKSILLSMKKS